MIAGRSAARRGIRAKHRALREEHEHKKKVQLEQAKIWFQQHVSGNWNPAHHRAAAKLELLRLALRRFDTDKTGVLSRDQLAKLLEHVAAVPPSEEALDTAMEAAKHVDTTGDGQPDTMGISKKAATMVVTKYVVRASETLGACFPPATHVPPPPPPRPQAYVAQQKVLDEIFDTYDTNKSGQLEPGQLRELLKRVSPDDAVTDEDEAYVMELCDKSKTGTILRSEALAACATWKSILERGDAPSKQSPGCGCTVL